MNRLPALKILKRLHRDKLLPNPEKVAKIVDLVSASPAGEQPAIGSLASAIELRQIAGMLSNHAKATSRNMGSLEVNLASKELSARVYQLAAAMGDKESRLQYAKALFEGKVIGREMPKKERLGKARNELEMLAKEQYPSAQYALAVHALANSELNNAFYYMQQAADNGFAMAQFQIGNWYRTGEIKTADSQRALHYLNKAHVNGIVEATFLVAGLYDQGIGTEVDRNKAFELYSLACSKGLAVAQHNMGCILLDNKNPRAKQDVPMAVEYFRMAASQQFIPSMINLVEIYLGGAKGVSTDKKAARQFFEMARTAKGASDPQLKTKLDELEPSVRNLQIDDKPTCLIL